MRPEGLALVEVAGARLVRLRGFAEECASRARRDGSISPEEWA